MAVALSVRLSLSSCLPWRRAACPSPVRASAARPARAGTLAGCSPARVTASRCCLPGRGAPRDGVHPGRAPSRADRGSVHDGPGTDAAPKRCWRTWCGPVLGSRFDARGRLYVFHSRDSVPDGSYQLRRVDLASGTSEDLGRVRTVDDLTGRHPPGADPPGRREGQPHAGRRGAPAAQGRRRARVPQFVGEDVCELEQRILFCAPVEGGPVLPVTSEQVLTFAMVPRSLRPGCWWSPPPSRRAAIASQTRLLLFRRGEPGPVRAVASAPLVSDPVVVSPDGQWVSFLEPGPSGGPPRLRLVELEGERAFALDLPSVPASPDGQSRRPPQYFPARIPAGPRRGLDRAAGGAAGHPARRRQQCPAGRCGPPAFKVEMGARVDRLCVRRRRFDEPTVSSFTSDGRRWLYQEGAFLHLIDADSPGEPQPAAGAGSPIFMGWRRSWEPDAGHLVLHGISPHHPARTRRRHACRTVRRTPRAPGADRCPGNAGPGGRSLCLRRARSPGRWCWPGVAPEPITLANNVRDFAVLSGCHGLRPAGPRHGAGVLGSRAGALEIRRPVAGRVAVNGSLCLLSSGAGCARRWRRSRRP